MKIIVLTLDSCDKYLAAWRNATGLSLPLPKQALGFAQAGVASPRPIAQGQRFAEFIPIFLLGGFSLLSLADESKNDLQPL